VRRPSAGRCSAIPRSRPAEFEHGLASIAPTFNQRRASPPFHA
jgi:hypothetical protein